MADAPKHIWITPGDHEWYEEPHPAGSRHPEAASEVKYVRCDPTRVQTIEREAQQDQEGESVRCSCEWSHPVDGFVRSEWPAELDSACPVHSGAEAPQEPERDKEAWAEIYDALFELLGREPTWAESVIAQEAMKATLRARVQRPSTSKGVAAYAPSHWRETLTDPEAKTIIGVTLHPDDAENWVPVRITPTEEET